MSGCGTGTPVPVPSAGWRPRAAGRAEAVGRRTFHGAADGRGMVHERVDERRGHPLPEAGGEEGA